VQKDIYPVPILRPKLHRPMVAQDVVPLEEQFKRLETGRDSPLTLVSAPAGYGKSTLVSGWLERSEEPSVWLALDEADNDPRTFLSHLVAALREEFPHLGKELVGAIRGQELPPSSVLAGVLGNELDDLDRRVVVALDDYYRVKSAAVHDFIDCLLEHPPRGLHLAVITRRDPPLRTRSLRANGQLMEVRMDALRLGPQEAATFLERATGRSVSEKTASRLHQATEGWPAGLRLASLALLRRNDGDEFLEGLDVGLPNAQRYLVSEVLAQQPPGVQDYLRKTSILEQMCAPLCEVLAAQDDGTDAISGAEFREVLEREGLFIVPMDKEGEWFRYHHLFKDLLRIQLEANATPAEINTLHGKAADWLGRNGSLEEALPHYSRSAEPAEEIESVVVRHFRAMREDEQWHRLANGLEMVPPEISHQSIDVQIIAALCADKRGRYGEMAQALDRAEELSAEATAEDRPHDTQRGQIGMMRAGLLAHLAQGREALERGESALRLLPDEALSDRAYALIMIACGLRMTGDLPRARLVLGEESERGGRESANFQGQLLQARCLIEWMSADLSSLRQCATAGLEFGQRHEQEETAIWSRFFLGAVHYHRGELQEAEAALAPVVESRYGPSFHIHILSVEVMAMVEQARGRPAQARELVDSLATHLLAIGNESYREYVEALQTELDLRQGRHRKALRWAMGYQAGTRWAGYHFSEAELTAAKVLLFEGDDDGVEKAGRMLEELRVFYASSCNNLFMIETLALQALFFAQRGAEDEAVARLADAIALARPSGFVRPFVDLGTGLAPLLHRLDLDQEGLQYVGRILSTLSAESERQPVEASGKITQSPELVEALTPREHEILSLLALHLSNKEIGARLFISGETVKHHVKNLYGKLAVHSRRDAVAKATGLGILGDDAAAARQ
jgi:LuxR family maltose regulon positive regulatory protein